ncbi:GNAT family N-acetyltransferase [Paenibacillus sp. GCM10027626]|uniref:GNAT family N-acetyltransferase n=1 Tax=Paenibacillus sp. GCM10027626 TaxID=3273411 RepID=UPI00362A2FF4
MHRILTSAELDTIRDQIDRDQHFLYYSYLTVRRPNTVHYGQFSDDGALLGVKAYLTGLPFYAFSIYPILETFCLRKMQAFMRAQLQLPDQAAGNSIINEAELTILASQLDLLRRPRKILLMKHLHQQALPPVDPQVVQLDASYYERIAAKMAVMQTMAFTEDELRYPFLGIIRQDELIAVGGYHIYTEDCVELGNIGTDAAWRRQGYGRKLCAELTRRGRAVSRSVYLNVFADNSGAIQLYHSLGFEVVCTQYMIEFL